MIVSKVDPLIEAIDEIKTTPEQLIGKIRSGNVVPLIGDELCFLINKLSKEQITLERFLARELAQSLGIKFTSQKLSEIARLRKNYDFYQDIRAIYKQIGTVGGPYEDYEFDYHVFDSLIKIGFKTFLSISFSDLLEKRVFQNGKDKVVIINCSLTQMADSARPSFPANDEKTTVIINLMGSVNGSCEFAVTEEEYLEYFYNIISGAYSKNILNPYISDRLKDSSFIYLGCHFPAWFTRYLVRGITQKRYTIHKLFHNFFIDEPPMDSSDRSFLKDHNSLIVGSNEILTFFDTLENGRNLSEQFIRTIQRSIELARKSPAQYEGQAFVSYYYENKKSAIELYESLRVQRIDTWFDQEHLRAGEHEVEIKERIFTCKVFIPVMSESMFQAIKKSRSTPGSDDENKSEKTEGSDKTDKPVKVPYSYQVEWPEISNKINAQKYNLKGKLDFLVTPCLLDETISKTDDRIPEYFRANYIYYYPSEKEKLIEDIKKYLKKVE